MKRQVLVIDRSGSMSTPMEKTSSASRLDTGKDAAKEVVRAKAKSDPLDRLAIVAFGTSATVVHPLVPVGANKATLLKVIDSIGIGGGTDIAAAITESARVLAENPGQHSLITKIILNKPGVQPEEAEMRTQMIICTDGSYTGRRPFGVAKTVKDSGTIIDVIGIAGSRTDGGFSEEYCQRIASPGRYVFVHDRKQLRHEMVSRACGIVSAKK